MKNFTTLLILVFLFAISCKKKNKEQEIVTANTIFNLSNATINNNNFSSLMYNVNTLPQIKFSFSAPVKTNTIASAISLKNINGVNVAYTTTLQNADKDLVIQPSVALVPISKYTVSITTALLSSQNVSLTNSSNYSFITAIDSTDKFPQISETALLDKVQQQTFKYFWDFGHPTSGMARERNTSGDVVTTGGTGFGVMAMIAAANRNFVTRTEASNRVLKIVNFLTNNCTKYHGAFAHWINGSTGATIPFSVNDNGGDLVETSLLLQGLITARQYFNSSTNPVEIDLRNKINAIYGAVEFNWYRQSNQNVLYWHWSPDKGWIINLKIEGWNEALIVYVLGASAPIAANKIPKVVYDNGFARNGNMRNNGTFFGNQLSLGPNLGGPLFFSHYSFLGINPNGLNDVYANYATQVTNHTKINYEYCKANPRGWFGYSNSCWGLTASDVPNGYHANEPGSNDLGVISPTAAISSMPYTPTESRAALKFFYYTLGDKLWGEYGFYDAFKLSDPWFANSTLAIDQGPIIVMIENYRSGLLWNLFISAPEVKAGMLSLGFTAPYL
jgi:hypothetical protein